MKQGTALSPESSALQMTLNFNTVAVESDDCGPPHCLSQTTRHSASMPTYLNQVQSLCLQSSHHVYSVQLRTHILPPSPHFTSPYPTSQPIECSFKTSATQSKFQALHLQCSVAGVGMEHPGQTWYQATTLVCHQHPTSMQVAPEYPRLHQLSTNPLAFVWSKKRAANRVTPSLIASIHSLHLMSSSVLGCVSGQSVVCRVCTSPKLPVWPLLVPLSRLLSLP